MKKLLVDTGREHALNAISALEKVFEGHFESPVSDARFLDLTSQKIVGVSGLPFHIPVLPEILKNQNINEWVNNQLRSSTAILFSVKNGILTTFVCREKLISTLVTPAAIAKQVKGILKDAPLWAGTLDELGRHRIEPSHPTPGPHFGTNLLMGNCLEVDKPLQKTPKSVVDQLGRGSFRSHADRQVLAAIWGVRTEENGHPANRQFYLTENGKQIFYSGLAKGPNLLGIETTHDTNHTVIRHKTRCGLDIERTIFIFPTKANGPLAVEAQVVRIKNTKKKKRSLSLTYTGMFGPLYPDAQRVDVVYTTLIQHGRLYRGKSGEILAVAPEYSPGLILEDAWFHSSVLHTEKEDSQYPTSFCGSISKFIGNGTLEHPAGLTILPNVPERKGPGFFAVATPFDLPPGKEVICDNFTGNVSSRNCDEFNQEVIDDTILGFVKEFENHKKVLKQLDTQLKFAGKFSDHLQVKTDEQNLDVYLNRNLPYQVLYQTFVSRSFDLTQKAFRQIGFREIQDLFASMPYFLAMGEGGLVRGFLQSWGNQVWELGYANHQFFWKGIEPGEYSDDGLWLFQAVGKYIDLTGDHSILDVECEIADEGVDRTRSLYDTLKAILRYSGEISVGKHGLPLIDKADWNDTLRVDPERLTGVEKEKRYRQQITDGLIKFGEPFVSDYTESAMNACLLRLAYTYMIQFAESRDDFQTASQIRDFDDQLVRNFQKHAWKEDFFARVLFNRPLPGGHTYMGAKGDGLGIDAPGGYYLNMFSWPILSGLASEEQIAATFQVIREHLMTPYGLRLNASVDFAAIGVPGSSNVYFFGDRENGGVFKHANMMAVAAMLKAANEVADRSLAADLLDLAYEIIDLVVPFRTMKDPYRKAGNPRFCTQYNNAENGENVGPTLSGTATWLLLDYLLVLGLNYRKGNWHLEPLLHPDQTEVSYTYKTGTATYEVSIKKPTGFARWADGNYVVECDGKRLDSPVIPRFDDGKKHVITCRL